MIALSTIGVIQMQTQTTDQVQQKEKMFHLGEYVVSESQLREIQMRGMTLPFAPVAID